ncbi:MAG: glycosyl hydrolase, partial [Acidobacteriota bacterium]
MSRARIAPIAVALFLCFIAAWCAPGVAAQPAAETAAPELDASTFAGLKLRAVGPALASGRIADLAVDPADPDTIYLAVASGGVWKTTNRGVTWTPIFDGEGSYSIGVVEIDPKNPSVIWVGSGENNSQRSVGYGDGVYKSLDGGATWANVGLGESEHIGMITIDPRDSNPVSVAAQGPRGSPGGDRGLYKTNDGGATWEK